MRPNYSIASTQSNFAALSFRNTFGDDGQAMTIRRISSFVHQVVYAVCLVVISYNCLLRVNSSEQRTGSSG